MSSNPYTIVKRPIITEKSSKFREQENKYTFMVDKKATKHQVKWAIEDLFKVKVEKVHTAIFPGKKRRVGVHEGYRPDWKKAIVKLKPGQRIEFEEKT